MRVFRLYGFSDGEITVITRGETVAQAMSYAARSNGIFTVRGRTIFPIEQLPINAKELYDVKHKAGWLYRAPVWLQKIEAEKAAKLGFENVLNTLFDREKEPVTLYEE